MRTLICTKDFNDRIAFRRWRETLDDLGVPLIQERLGPKPFVAKWEVAAIGPIRINRISQSAVRGEATPNLIRRHGKDGTVVVAIKLAGESVRCQDGRSSRQRAGDLVLFDHRPAVHESSDGGRTLFLEFPRERLERILGPTHIYSSLTVESQLASTRLATTFFRELTQVRQQLTASVADRLAGIGIDLIAASISERLAQEVPHSIHGTVVFQRAKAYVEANLSDPTLDPTQIAAAVGVSLRRLQELFHERNQHISDWIWQRRLEKAAACLADPSRTYLLISTIAYNYGFVTQAHFARRFRARYGVTPTEYRAGALVTAR
ncbi:AraC family transcriptional regulator [Methylobacterium fujisawaense]|uniref:helix-turn-helix domain-containing protein n=1 Tax=Methylobacterium fujisawaense TaxID=107400 RepID=UPI002F31EE94